MEFIPTESDQEVINKLREEIKGSTEGWKEIEHDAALLRWLKFYEMDYEKTMEALLKTYNWRKEIGLDTILTDYTPDPELAKLYSYDVVGFDKEGCPVVCYDVIPRDSRAIMKKYGKDAIIKLGEYHLERITQLFYEKDTREKPVQQIVFLVDSKKMTMKQITAPGATELSIEQIKRTEPHYPNCVKLMVVINAPRVAKLALKIVKPFVNDQTLSNVKIYPKCNAKVRKLLLELIDEENLPQKYGGKKEFGEFEPNANDDEEEDECGEEEMLETKISGGKKLKLEYDVEKPNSQLCWSFQTEYRDIGFSVFLDNKESTVFPHEKFSSSILHTNSITCEKPGKYVVCFDNKENRFRSVNLKYLIAVYPPDKEGE